MIKDMTEDEPPKPPKRHSNTGFTGKLYQHRVSLAIGLLVAAGMVSSAYNFGINGNLTTGFAIVLTLLVIYIAVRRLLFVGNCDSRPEKKR